MLGKKLYKTSMLWAFKFIVFALVLFFLNDFYLDTITDDRFSKMVTEGGSRGRRVLDFFEFILKYPGDAISFALMIVLPAFYFAFIRGVRFYEKAVVVNRGIPFFNQKIPYDEVKTYKLLHPQLAISMHTKNGDIFVIADEQVERAIAILDQHNIQGDLGQGDLVKIFANYKKFIVFIASFVILLFIVRKLGLYFFYA
jgi:hypothetical protein